MSQGINRELTFKAKESGWWNLYRVGGAAALMAVIFFRRNCGVELTTFNGFGIFTVPETAPTSASGWFTLLQNDAFVGLSLLNFIDLVNYTLVGLIFLALYRALRQTNRSAMVVATAFGLVGMAVFLASNQAFAMLSLSEKYEEASSETQRSMLLAAGEALLAANEGTGYYAALFLVLLGGLIISLVMLQSDVFNKATAIVGILANGIGLMYFIVLAIAPVINWLPPTLSAPFRMIWYILIAVKLFQLSVVDNSNEQ